MVFERFFKQEGEPRPNIFTDLPSLKFRSVNEARWYLDWVFEVIEHLAVEYGRALGSDDCLEGYQKILDVNRKMTQASLDTWLHTYVYTVADSNHNGNSYEMFAYRILRLYHTMAMILCATCTTPHDQTIFDAYLT